MSLLAIHALGFAYADWPVLEEIDLTCRVGRCYGILGPNGSGKTTLLDLCCGLLRPDQGEVRFDGIALPRWSRNHLAQQIALVPQESRFNFAFTVAEVVLMGRHPHRSRFAPPTPEDRRLVTRAMAMLDINHLADRPVTCLSGGEKQRLVVARALVQEPRLLLLDEATASLDIFHTLAILRIIRQRVREEGLTVLAAMHDLNLAAWFCDELIILHQGRIRAQGPVAQVLNPDIIHQVFGVHCQVQDDGGDNLQVHYLFREEV